MRSEADAIPYHPASLLGERLMVLAPHPDDEVIGCGGVVAHHAREGRWIRVVVVTDGGAATAEGIDREDESRRGLETLGATSAELRFLRFRDRALDDSVIPALAAELEDFRPDLILAPSPVEIHPDHFALARALCNLVQQHATLFADLALTRVAFYEVGQPLRPNALVPIDEVADMKLAAIREHRSQSTYRDYAELVRGLNVYRAMTLPDSRIAEAYFTIALPELRTTSVTALRQRVGAPLPIEVRPTALPVSVVIRTKDRPLLLREAVESVRATGYPCEIVVVNDGGARPEIEGVRLVEHQQSRGRSAAANAGVEAASGAFVCFLDDDDLFYAEHFDVLTAAVNGSRHIAHYTDAISAFLRTGESGKYETHSRLRLFAQDFDPALLLLDNYIPLPTILVPRNAYLEVGGFDPDFDLFEDWDFLIRLARKGSFLRVPRVTVEVRHFEGGSSIVLAAPEGSDRFRTAKLQVWHKHRDLLGNDVFAAGLETQKRRINALYSDVAETRGALSAARLDIERGEREKGSLLTQLQEVHQTAGTQLLRLREVESTLALASSELANARLHNEALQAENSALRANDASRSAELAAARVEIERLNGLLGMIFRSRTWKMHNILERMRGRR